MTDARPQRGPGRPGTDRWSRVQLIAIVVITLGLMLAGVLVPVLGDAFPFVPDATPLPTAATPPR